MFGFEVQYVDHQLIELGALVRHSNLCSFDGMQNGCPVPTDDVSDIVSMKASRSGGYPHGERPRDERGYTSPKYVDWLNSDNA